MKHKVLNVYQLLIYELLNFVLNSLSNLHQEPQLNDMFTFIERRITCSSAKPLLNEPFCRRQTEKKSIKASASKLFNALSNADVFPEDIVCGCEHKITNFHHNFKKIYFVNNDDIVDSLFACFFFFSFLYYWINATRG